MSSQTRCKRKRTVIISYSLQKYSWGSLDGTIKEMMERTDCGAGTGFGMRNLEFWTDLRLSVIRKRMEESGLDVEVC